MSPADPDSRYEVGRSIARGGMGEILEAQDLHFGRRVAMKVILAHRGSHRSIKTRFVQEARILSQLEHPNIVPVHDLDKDDQGRVFYTMKLVKGMTLRDVLKGIREEDPDIVAKYPLSQLLNIFLKICDGMAYAHSRGIIHRDLKPENIMLGEFGEVWVMDWGLAKILRSATDPAMRGGSSTDTRGRQDEQDVRDDLVGVEATEETLPLETDANAPDNPFDGELPTANGQPLQGPDLTLEGQVMGTPQYMAPEQAEGRIGDLDERTDIFALGGILYTILTLRPPTSGNSVQEILDNIKSGYIPPPRIYVKSRRLQSDGTFSEKDVHLLHCPGRRIPEALTAVTMKAMATDPDDRYESANALRDDVQAFISGFATTAEITSSLHRLGLWVRRNKAVTLAVTCLALFLGYAAYGNWKMARTLTQLRETAPTFNEQALSLMQQQDFTNALVKIEYAIQLDGSNPNWHEQKGNILQGMLNWNGSAAAYARAVQLGGRHSGLDRSLHFSQRLQAERNPSGAEYAALLRQLNNHLIDSKRSSESVMIAAQLDRLEGVTDALVASWKRKLSASGWEPVIWHDASSGNLNIDIPAGAKSLEPLRGMPLNRFGTEPGLATGDLSPLSGMPLTELIIHGSTRVQSLEPLRGMNLVNLNIQHCVGIHDLEPIRGMPLKQLWTTGSSVRDLMPLEQASLEHLEADKITNGLEVLRAMPLKSLWLSYDSQDPQLKDIEFLRNRPLEDLRLSGTQIESLAPLIGMSLTNLLLYECQNLKDITAISGMPLIALHLHHLKGGSLEPLRGMPLKTLRCPYETTRIDPLAGMPLEALELDHTEVRDLSPLAGMPLRRLHLHNSRSVQDITPLAGMPLEYLNLFGCGLVKDFRPLMECTNLRYLNLPQNAKDIDYLKNHPSLVKICFLEQNNRWDQVPSIDEFWTAWDKRQGKP